MQVFFILSEKMKMGNFDSFFFQMERGEWNNVHSKSNTYITRDRNKQEGSSFGFFLSAPYRCPCFIPILDVFFTSAKFLKMYMYNQGPC